MNLWWIDLSYACAGIFVNDEGVVIQAAPIFGWMRGKRFAAVEKWVHDKHGDMEQAS